MESVSAIPGVRLLGTAARKAAVVAFTMNGVHPHDIASLLDGDGICIRAGHHCTQPLHRRLGVPASARASFAPYNTHADVDALARGLAKVQQDVRRMSTTMAELYQSVIIEHDRSPRNFRVLADPSRRAEGRNPMCGDEVSVELQLDGDGRITDIGFQGRGCAISRASASLMTAALQGKTTAEARELFDRFHALVTRGEPGDTSLGKLEAFRGVAEFPMRVKCATLAWHAMKTALGAGDARRNRLGARRSALLRVGIPPPLGGRMDFDTETAPSAKRQAPSAEPEQRFTTKLELQTCTPK